MDANCNFLLVRTDKQAKKQEGISFLLVPVDMPGITVRLTLVRSCCSSGHPGTMRLACVLSGNGGRGRMITH